jgi:signal transduction histidine kinase/CHASE3 domain sensor protein
MRFLKHNLTSVVLVTVLVISIFMLLFAASISYRQVQTLKKSQESVELSYKIYVELVQLSSFAATAETSQRGFLLTGDSIFLHPYYESLEKIKWSFARLSLLTQDNYDQNRRLDTLVKLVNQRIRSLDQNLGIRTAGFQRSDPIRGLLLKGHEMMSVSLAQIDKMIFNELRQLRDLENAQSRDFRLPPVALLFIVFFSILVFSVAFYKINNDLSSVVRTNNQLLITNKIFEQSEEIADISHWYWNTRENKMTYSINLYRLLGCRVNEFEPTFENYLQFVHPADRHHLIYIKKKAIREQTPSTAQYRVLRKDGEQRYFKTIGKLITDNFGTSFSIGIHSDVTEQNKKDRLLGEKITDLERSNKQLSAFSHIASHDLQEPLRKVQTFISRIKGKDLNNLPDNIKDYISGIRKETIRMQKFITDLLLYSRASKADKTFEFTDLNEILENSKRELSHRIEEKNAIINSAGDLPATNVIPFQIQQLFSNLISNSIKYSKPGTNPIIDVTRELATGKDIPNYNDDPDSWFHVIVFSDNGIGFDQQYAEKIFTLFYRLHSNNEYTGTGIGLAICKIIAENHKGYITAKGVPGRGSTFRIYLPAR